MGTWDQRVEILDPTPAHGWAAKLQPYTQGLAGLSQPIADSVCVGCSAEFLTHPNTLRGMTQYKDARLRGCARVHALIQSCLLQAQLCLNKRDKGDGESRPLPTAPPLLGPLKFLSRG